MKDFIELWYGIGWMFCLITGGVAYEMYDNWRQIHKMWFVIFLIYAFFPFVIILAEKLCKN